MKRALLLYFLSVVLLASGVSCTKDIIDTTGNLTGTVTDAKTNEPLSGVSISISPSGTTRSTGADGKFEFRDLETKEYTVTASKNGYKTDKKNVFVQTGQDAFADFQLTSTTGTLQCSPNMLDFDSDKTTLPFEISNVGVAELKWQLTENASWLSCNPTSGVTNPSEKSSVVVIVDRTGLDSGEYTQSITVTSDGGGSAIVNVKMTVQGINVSYSPTKLDFGSVTSSLPLTLTNTGTKDITYSLSTSNQWINLSKTSGTFSKTDNVIVSVNRAGLAEGDHNGSIELVVSDQKSLIPVSMNIPSREKPVVSTIMVEDATYNSANFRGSIVRVGSSEVTSHGFCWATSNSPTIEAGFKCNLGDSKNPRDFSYKASNLTELTTYYVRAYAENQEGISYGEELTFTTKGTPKLASVSTGNVSGITDTGAVIGGSIDNLGNVDKVIQYGHVWNTSGNPTVNDQKTELGSADKLTSFNSSLTGLLPSTVYHVKAYATNSVGTSYGAEITFRTPSSNSINIEGYGDDNKWIP